MTRCLSLLLLITLTTLPVTAEEPLAPVVTSDGSLSDDLAEISADFDNETPLTESCCDGCWGHMNHPRLEFSGGYLRMAREYNHNTPIVTAAGSGNPVLSMKDWGGNYEDGFALRAQISQIEVRYLQISNNVDATIPASIANQLVYLRDAYFSDLVLDYDTDLYSGEINRQFSTPYSSIRLNGGFRYLRLQEDITASFPGFAGVIYTNTRNELYGLQLGADVDVLTSECLPISLVGFAKAGLYYSDTSLESYPNAAGAVQLGATADASERLAFVGEIGIKAQMQVTNRATLDVGYQLLFIDGVALAGDQPQGIDQQSLAPATSSIHTGNVFYHGLNAGFTLRF